MGTCCAARPRGKELDIISTNRNVTQRLLKTARVETREVGVLVNSISLEGYYSSSCSSRRDLNSTKRSGYDIETNKSDSRRANVPQIPINKTLFTKESESQSQNSLMHSLRNDEAIENSRSFSENPESKPRDLLSLIKSRNSSVESIQSSSVNKPHLPLERNSVSEIKLSPSNSISVIQLSPDGTPYSNPRNLLTKKSSFLNIPEKTYMRQESLISEDSGVFSDDSVDSDRGGMSPIDILAPLKDPAKDFQSAKTMKKHVSIRSPSKEDLSIEKSTLKPTARNSFMTIKKVQVIHTKEINRVKLTNDKFQLNQYTADCMVGQGAFGKVYRAKDSSGNLVAIKIYNKQQLRHRWIGKAKTALFAVKCEIEIMEKLEHPNVLQLYEVIENDVCNKIYMILEFAPGGTLNEISPMEEKEALYYFKQLILGLEYLHEKALVVHRDIKPQNLLLDEHNNLKISDFGSAQEMANGRDEFSNSAGTWAFMAPELHGGNGSFKGRPVDIWAVGVTLFYMLEGKTPFNGRRLIDLYEAVKNQEVVVPEKYNDDLKDLILKMLNKDPDQRASIEQIKSHPWVKLV
ncbi:unnamed protein product [Blepharisma stoltei]|uniref:Protein kinase domain-containing protein n=1 Tax=Blepharisma stoltei TaxID=1481888 RepID=A0AAU9IUL4_9CILI|nr:unnamed protein product [Blepharisma stoltei]